MSPASIELLFKEIESTEFAMLLKSQSGWRSIVNVLTTIPVLQALVEALKIDSNKELLLARMADLLQTRYTPRFLHPYDSALTGYLDALSKADGSAAQSLANKMIRNPDLWWSRLLARSLIEHPINLTTPETLLGWPERFEHANQAQRA